MSIRRFKLLIVDDEIDIRETLKDYYEQDNYHVLIASSGNEALKILENEDIDFVLSDIRMPDGDGIYLLSEIKKNRINSPTVLLMSGFSELKREDAISKGAIDLLSKPLDFSIVDGYMKQYSIQ